MPGAWNGSGCEELLKYQRLKALAWLGDLCNVMKTSRGRVGCNQTEVQVLKQQQSLSGFNFFFLLQLAFRELMSTAWVY